VSEFKLDRRSVVGGLAGSTLLLGASGRALAQDGGQTQPNIIFIMADDLGYADLGCTGSRYARTPHIDSIARNGLLLTQGYSNSSICSPTRTGLLSGCYQYRFPVGLEEPLGPTAPEGIGLPAERRTIAEVLRERGYETALVGKWHLGSPPAQGPLAYGYDHFLGITGGAADYFRHRVVIGGEEEGPNLFEGNSEIERVGYLTDLFGDEAVNRIREKTKPIFLSLHFTAPHWPWEGREDEMVAEQLRDFRHHDGGNLQTYYDMISAMDDNVGKVLTALREAGELENSIVIFTSDNGGERFSDTWPFTGMKAELLEGGIRVPILVQWPERIAPGSISEQVMISMDFLPTLYSIAGGRPAESEFDGIDLSGQLLGDRMVVERTLYWRMKAHQQAAVRNGDWKYLKLGDKEYLFNLSEDPRERAVLNDLYPKKLQELKLAWSDWNEQMLPYPLSSYSWDNKDYSPDRY